MKTQLKYLVSNLLLVGMTGAALFLTGCPEIAANNETGCTDNTECSDGQFCDATDSTCKDGCASSDDCTTAGEECLSDPADDTGASNVCRAPADCSEAADGAAYCVAELGLAEGETASCDTSGDAPTCTEANPVQQRYVQILDVSTEGASCMSETNGQGDPGSDIMFARLLNASDEVVGFAKAVNFVDGSAGDAEQSMNGYTDFATILAGTAPDLDDMSCPMDNGGKFRTDTILTLGCGGFVVVEFLDMEGTWVPIEPGFKVEVGEYDSECNNSGNSGADRYRVFGCETRADAQITDMSTDTDIDAACTTDLSNDDSVGITISEIAGG